MLLLASLALAGPYVVSVGEEQTLGVGGGWPRVFVDDDDATAWRFVWSAGGDYAMLPMTPELTVEDRDRTNLTGRTDLVDHAITRCPDGSFLHAASAQVAGSNDTAYLFRYGADLDRTVEGALADADDDEPHNDLAVICSGVVDGVGFGGVGGDPVFVPFGADGTVGAEIRLDDAAMLMGGSLRYEAETDTLLAVNFTFQGTLRVARFTPDFELVETIEREDVTEPGLKGYWAQALVRVGDTYILGHMARDESLGWAADEGDVWLTFFDTSWNVLDRVQVSRNVPPTGGMRPGLARRGDQLLVTYDKQVQPRIFDVRLDLAALGEEGDEDSGVVPTDDDTGGGGGVDTPPCGCATTGGLPGAGLLVVATVLAARRRAS